MEENMDIIKCPACGKDMTPVYIPETGFSVDVCVHGCGGVFFDNKELKYFDEQHENMQEIINALDNKTFEKTDETQIRVCPVCGNNMVKNYSSVKKEVQIDECYACGGKFLDYKELDKIRAEYRTEKDRADAAIKALYDTAGIELEEIRQKADKTKARHPLYKQFIDKFIFG